MVSSPSCRAEAAFSSQVVSTPASMMFIVLVGDALVVERRGAEAAAPVRLVGDGDALGEHPLAELLLQERDAARHRRAGDRADQRPQRRGGDAVLEDHRRGGRGDLARAEPRRPRGGRRRRRSARRDGRSARQRVWRPSPARSIAEPSPAIAPGRDAEAGGAVQAGEAAAGHQPPGAGRPVGRAGVGVGDAGRRRARRPRPPAPAPPAPRRPARRRRRGRGRAAARAPAGPRARGRRRGPPAPAAPSPRPARSAWRGPRPRRRSPTPWPGGGRRRRARRDRGSPRARPPPARRAARSPTATGARRTRPRRRRRRRPGLGHDVLQQVLIHAAHMADGPAGDKPGRAGRALLRLPHGARLGAVDRENQGARRSIGRSLEGEGDVDARTRRR